MLKYLRQMGAFWRVLIAVIFFGAVLRVIDHLHGTPQTDTNILEKLVLACCLATAVGLDYVVDVVRKLHGGE